MSHPAPPTRAVPPARPDDLVALTRALVFTKEAYRTLRLRSVPLADAAAAPTETPMSIAAPQLTASALALPAAAEKPIRRGGLPAANADPAGTTASGRPLTPWELIDDGDSIHGVTFAAFQRRPHDPITAQDAA